MELYTSEDIQRGLILNQAVASDWRRHRGFVPVINIAARTADANVADAVLTYCRAANGWIGLYSGQAVQSSRVRGILSALELCTSA